MVIRSNDNMGFMFQCGVDSYGTCINCLFKDWCDELGRWLTFAFAEVIGICGVVC